MIPNIVVYRGGEEARLSFGSIYPTDFSAHVLYALMAWFVVRKEKISSSDYLLGIMTALFVRYASGARNSALCIIIFLALVFIARTLRRKIANIYVWGQAGAVVSFVGLELLNIILCLIYKDNDPFWEKLNLITNNRLRLGASALQGYGTKMFGQFINEIGAGGVVEFPENYYFIDSSYIRILVENGLLVCCSVTFIWCIISYRAKKHCEIELLVTQIVAAIHCFSEHHMLELVYLFVFFAAFSKMEKGSERGIVSKSVDIIEEK